MNIEKIVTNRLILNEIQEGDHEFIFMLVNSPGWLKFIGDRKIRTTEDAIAYIRKIGDHPQITYWTVTQKPDAQPVGIITLVKRGYLEYYDIGFAFLPEYTGRGYASEATTAVLQILPADLISDKILAVTTQENSSSVKLLEKLNFTYETAISEDGKTLLQYALSSDEIQIGKLVGAFFGMFDNSSGEPDFSLMDKICTSSVSIIKKSGTQTEMYGPESFIEPRRKILTDGTLQEFSEFEVGWETKIAGNIAHRYSKYRKKGWLKGNLYEGTGHKFFHLIKNEDGWKIAHVLWEDDGHKDNIVILKRSRGF